GIAIRFEADPTDRCFRTGDYWLIPARVANRSIEPLDRAPPRGIHHHFVKLAVHAAAPATRPAGLSQKIDTNEKFCRRKSPQARRVFQFHRNEFAPSGEGSSVDLRNSWRTVDHQYDPVDGWGVREALIQAFRGRGIRPRGTPFFSEDGCDGPSSTPAL